MIVNGETVAEGSGANVLGDPVEALVWLANDQRERGAGLLAGQVVITGSCTGVNMAVAGDRVRADFGELGAVELEFT
jgi:2-keto-4-pentenoate hydratase